MYKDYLPKFCIHSKEHYYYLLIMACTWQLAASEVTSGEQQRILLEAPKNQFRAAI